MPEISSLIYLSETTKTSLMLFQNKVMSDGCWMSQKDSQVSNQRYPSLKFNSTLIWNGRLGVNVVATHTEKIVIMTVEFGRG